MDLSKQIQGSQDIFSNVKYALTSTNSRLTQTFEEDRAPNKINLIPASFSDSSNKLYNFKIAKQVQDEVVRENLDKDYIAITGDPNFNKEAQKLIFGKHTALISEEKIVTIETVSGSNALRIIFQFLKDFCPADVYVSDHTWENHISIPQKVGLSTKPYPFLDFKVKNIDFKGMYTTLESANPGSIVVLHASAYNPAGIEPSYAQWKSLANLFKNKRLVAIFDCAGQGLVSGDLEKDITSIKAFLEEGTQVIVCQSVSSSLGIYGEMIGALHITCKSKDVANKVLDQIKLIVRTIYSNPPCNGGWIAVKLLGKLEYRSQWERELKGVAQRFRDIRSALYEELKQKQGFEYLIEQEGPFSHLELLNQQKEVLLNKYHIYVAEGGNVSFENIKIEDVKYIAEGLREVLNN